MVTKNDSYKDIGLRKVCIYYTGAKDIPEAITEIAGRYNLTLPESVLAGKLYRTCIALLVDEAENFKKEVEKLDLVDRVTISHVPHLRER